MQIRQQQKLEKQDAMANILKGDVVRLIVTSKEK
jgi:hypothetical protein